MTIGKNLSNEVKGFGVLVMVIVIISIILLKLRVNDSVACAGSYTFNDTLGYCCLSTTNCSSGFNATARALYTDINSYVVAFSEPKNWVIIIIIAVIGIYLMRKFAGKKNGM